ncbi:hypothetical protein GOP47_0029064 [Adiantum capillus-veneris]|nr:hypothetical protein GOP47_0029064 [Adiantum capillus-veneris]
MAFIEATLEVLVLLPWTFRFCKNGNYAHCQWSKYLPMGLPRRGLGERDVTLTYIICWGQLAHYPLFWLVLLEAWKTMNGNPWRIEKAFYICCI